MKQEQNLTKTKKKQSYRAPNMIPYLPPQPLSLLFCCCLFISFFYVISFRLKQWENALSFFQTYDFPRISSSLCVYLKPILI